MATKPRKPRIIFEATPETVERVRFVAQRIDQTVSGVVRRAVIEFLERMENPNPSREVDGKSKRSS